MGRPRPVSLAIQDFQIQQRFPSFKRHFHRVGHGLWTGTLQPRESSPVYHVELRYRVHVAPTVKVLRPDLAPGAPHLYPDGTLCLYWPKEWGWTSDQLIVNTVLPWAADWLYYYELWLDCGKWLGPESPHRSTKLRAEDQDAA
jgi:hypothetical protein